MEIKYEDLAAELKEEITTNGPIFSLIDIIASTHEILATEELFYRQIEDWISFTRNDFDCHVNGEPYQAVNFMVNLETGQFIVRVWSRTVKMGFLGNPDCVRDKIQETFHAKVPCTGFFQDDQEQIGKILFSDFPFSRMLSSQCNFLTKLRTDEDEGHKMLCKACRRIDDDSLDQDDAALADTNEEPLDKKPDIKKDYDEVCNDVNEPSPQASMDYIPESPEPPVSGGKSKSKRTFNCEMCDETFASTTAKMNHLHDVHNEKTPFGCEICGKKFAKNVSLKFHKAGSHGIVTIPCKLCKQKFNKIELFMEHFRSTHNEEEKITCFKCKEQGWKSVIKALIVFTQK